MRMESDAHAAGIDFVEAGEAFGAVEVAVLPGDVRGHVEGAGGGAFIHQIDFSQFFFELAEIDLDVRLAGGGWCGIFCVTKNKPGNQAGQYADVEDKGDAKDFSGARGQSEIIGRRIF